MSEYLNRLKHLRDATPPPGNAKNVQDNISFRKAIDYIDEMEALVVKHENQERYLLARLKEADEKREADRVNLDNIIKQYRIKCNGENTLVKSSVIRRLISEYYEVE